MSHSVNQTLVFSMKDAVKKAVMGENPYCIGYDRQTHKLYAYTYIYDHTVFQSDEPRFVATINSTKLVVFVDQSGQITEAGKSFCTQEDFLFKIEEIAGCVSNPHHLETLKTISADPLNNPMNVMQGELKLNLQSALDRSEGETTPFTFALDPNTNQIFAYTGLSEIRSTRSVAVTGSFVHRSSNMILLVDSLGNTTAEGEAAARKFGFPATIEGFMDAAANADMIAAYRAALAGRRAAADNTPRDP